MMVADLTPREREVLTQIAAGMTSKEIAAASGTSRNTVRNHRTSIMAKLGAESAPHAVAIAMRRGLVS
jgi:DNA-binding CsgD family transcriptional regulator